MKKSVRMALMLVLTLASLFGGFAFYRMSSGDLMSSVAFGFGLLGIIFSLMRNSKQ